MMAGLEIKEGRVSKNSGLYRSLTENCRHEIMGLRSHPDLSLKQLSGSHPVFLIKDHDSDKRFILKSFFDHGVSTSRLLRRLDKEYGRLKYLARLQAGGRRTRCVKPVCRDRKALFIVEEEVKGRNLGHFAKEAMRKDGSRLYDKLDLLTGFLFDMHSKTASGERIDAGVLYSELARHAIQSLKAGSVSRHKFRKVLGLARRWCHSYGIRHAYRSMVHGDATVSNFLFRGNRMFAIDLERSMYVDPVYDLGMIAGELFNEALTHADNPYRADPYIGHMYWAYSGHCGDQRTTFCQLTSRNPLYMANSLLRMSRNEFFSPDHRQKLAEYALKCLQSPPPG